MGLASHRRRKEKIFLTSQIMVSGNMTSAMTSFSNTDGGCLENHLQFVTSTLVEGSNRARALSIIAAPSAVAMKLHGYHGHSSGSSTATRDSVVLVNKGAIATMDSVGDAKNDAYTVAADQEHACQETHSAV
jgi:hypothetical protein